MSLNFSFFSKFSFLIHSYRQENKSIQSEIKKLEMEIYLFQHDNIRAIGVKLIILLELHIPMPRASVAGVAGSN